MNNSTTAAQPLDLDKLEAPAIAYQNENDSWYNEYELSDGITYEPAANFILAASPETILALIAQARAARPAQTDDDAMIEEAVRSAKVRFAHPDAETTQDIGRAVLAAERRRAAQAHHTAADTTAIYVDESAINELRGDRFGSVCTDIYKSPAPGRVALSANAADTTASASEGKPFAGPGAWFSIDILGNPMREYAPGKWENCEWPSSRAAQPVQTGVAGKEAPHGSDER